jgi:diaminopimelate epimerase
MKINFTKMQGCGNDYVYVDTVKEAVVIPDKAELARLISDRHFGVGSDGLIFVNRSDKAGFEMEMYNADGSRGEMCGNGMRCVAKIIYDRGYVNTEKFTVESMGSIKNITVFPKDGKADLITVDMGEPVLEPELVPVKASRGLKNAVNMPIETEKLSGKFTAVSMGNPHAVIFMDSLCGYEGTLSDMPLEKYGPSFENHELFPARVNTEFIEVINEHEVNLRVWERGSGETLACGTGCSATVVAGTLTGKTSREIKVNVRGGALSVNWSEHDNHVYMTGPAKYVFDGTFEY